MNKKQKKVLIRILVAAVLMIVFSQLPGGRICEISAVLYDPISGYRI